MKLKSFVWTLGLKPRVRTYETKLISFSLEKDGEIEYAKWLHPKDYFVGIEQGYVDKLRQYISPGDTVLDVGAHCGDFSLPLALAAGKQGTVIAWEPNPYVFKVLEQNARLNRNKTNIQPVMAAVSPNDEPLTFHYSDPGMINGGNLGGISKWIHGHPYKLEVPGRNLHRWMNENCPERISRISFVKVDTEGFDLEVLKTIESIIVAQNPVVHVEFYRHLNAEKRRDLWSFLHDREYDLFTTDSAYGVEPVDQVDLCDVMKWRHFDTIAFPRSSHFVPQSVAA
jgi:FkbM family methyltransferase